MRKIPVLFVLILAFHTIPADTYKGYTIDSWPPFMYVENNRITGIATEIVREVFRDSHIDMTVEAVQWTRAYDSALKEQKSFIYLLYRTDEREPLFKWVGPIVPAIDMNLYRLKKRDDITANSLEDAKSYRIGVVRGVANHKYLIDQGFEEGVNLEAVSSPGQNIALIINGRIDLLINTEFTLPRLLQGTGLTRDDFEIVFTAIESEPGYIGLNINTPDAVIENLEKSYGKLESWGVIDSIYNKFLQ